MMQDARSCRNVLFAAYHFPPCGGPGVQRPAKFAKYLPEFGYDPLVLTASEEAIESTKDESLLDELRDTKVFRCRGHERFIVRLPRKLGLRRLTSFFLRPDANRLAWLPSARRMVRRIASEHPIHVIYTCVDPYSSALLGRQLKRDLGVPWVVDYRDPWTLRAGGVWPSKLHYQIEVRQEKKVLESADAIIVVTPTMKDDLVKRSPCLEHKIHVIHNGFDPTDFPTSGSAGHASELRIGYTGVLMDHDKTSDGAKYAPLVKLWASSIGYQYKHLDRSTHSPYYLLHAVRALIDEHPEFENSLRLEFAGRFGDKNHEIVRQLQLENVVSVHGHLPHKESVRLLMDSDVLFLPMQDMKGPNCNLSGKVFEYLAAGKPILTLVGEGDLRDLIRQAHGGWCVDPRDVEAIKRTLEDLIKQKMAGTLNTKPDKPYVAQFERRTLTRKLARVFDSLLQR